MNVPIIDPLGTDAFGFYSNPKHVGTVDVSGGMSSCFR